MQCYVKSIGSIILVGLNRIRTLKILYVVRGQPVDSLQCSRRVNMPAENLDETGVERPVGSWSEDTYVAGAFCVEV